MCGIFNSFSLSSLQEELKESDRSLMEIFKQLQGDVADLNVYVQSWRYSTVSSNRDSFVSEGRPVSASDLDFHILDEPDEPDGPATESTSTSNHSLESTLTSSKGSGSSKTMSESHLAPDVDSAHGSSTYSPVLSSQGLTTSAHSTNKYRMTSSMTTSNITGAKQQISASPQLKSSASMNKISSSSASPSLITRLQDETSSVTSRHSSESIDSGVQIENGSANGVEATNTTSAPSGVTTIAESDIGFGDFASDVFSTLGFRT